MSTQTTQTDAYWKFYHIIIHCLGLVSVRNHVPAQDAVYMSTACRNKQQMQTAYSQKHKYVTLPMVLDCFHND